MRIQLLKFLAALSCFFLLSGTILAQSFHLLVPEIQSFQDVTRYVLR
ncbi:MAG: hypothetical protein IPP02_07865 [Chitinophagaceae bacterium]|nr:hypothetical protein [Chitinophagaceae bacterium]